MCLHGYECYAVEAGSEEEKPKVGWREVKLVLKMPAGC